MIEYVTFASVKHGDVLCRLHFPFKPFVVTEINLPDKQIVIATCPDRQHQRVLSSDEFDACCYVDYIEVCQI
jgi:hypothetical protein